MKKTISRIVVDLAKNGELWISTCTADPDSLYLLDEIDHTAESPKKSIRTMAINEGNLFFDLVYLFMVQTHSFQ